MKHGLFIIILLILYGNTASGFLSGPIAGRTGAPNDICDSLTCNTDPCHTSYRLDTGRAKFSITVPTTYEKSKTIDVLITFDNSNTGLHGFEITAMDTTNTKVGTFTSTDDTTQTESYLNQYAAHTTIGTANQAGRYNGQRLPRMYLSRLPFMRLETRLMGTAQARGIIFTRVRLPFHWRRNAYLPH